MTRAMFIFIDSKDAIYVYKHSGGWPSEAYESIKKSFDYAFPADFEACDFSAAFIAANKPKGGGGVYLSKDSEGYDTLDYIYEISSEKNESLVVKCYRVCANSNKLIFHGFFSSFEGFIQTYNSREDCKK